MNPELVIQALGITITAIFSIAQYSSKTNRKLIKEELKLDIEIRDKFSPESEEYKTINRRIDELFELAYKNSGPRFHIYHWDDLAIGASLVAFASYLTLWLVELNNYWAALTAFMAVVGFGMIPDAFKPESSND